MKHISVKNDSDNTSTLIEALGPAPSNLEFSGWQGSLVDELGLTFFIFDIAPDAEEYPLHSSNDTWLAYVILGSGTLNAGTQAGQKTESCQYQAGDVIAFEPDTQHGWKNDNAPSKILFVKRSD